MTTSARRVVLAVLGCVLLPAAARAQYFATDLGTLGGRTSEAFAVNDAGQIVGESQTAGFSTHAFSWTAADGMVDLGTLGGSSSTARAINNFGQIVGSSSTGSGLRAFSRMPGGPMIDLGTLGGTWSEALGVNDNGQIVGRAGTATGSEHAFFWSQSTGMLDLGTLGGSKSIATAINNAGVVVGYSDLANGTYAAFMWTSGGGLVNLGLGVGLTSTSANAITNSGRIVGSTLTQFWPNPTKPPMYIGSSMFRREPDGQTTFFSLPNADCCPQALGANDAGIVVGTSNGRAFIWRAGELPFEPRAPGVASFAAARDVNENGVIVGLARTAGIQRAMMWTRRERPRDLTIDFGPMHGAFRYANGAFTPVHWLSPEASVRADLDANPVDDLVVDFGAGVGLWALSNGTSWTALHPFSPERMAAGDLDGNGQDDLVLDFAGYGLWVLHNNTNWTHLHTMSPTHLAVGDVNGWGGEDVVIYLPGHGLWVFENNLAWRQLYEGEITLLHIADIEGDGGEEVIVNIPGQGLRLGPWNWRALNDNPATFVASGDVDGGRTDLLISFPGYGTWLFRNGGTWVQVHLLEAEDAAFIDLDGNGNDAIVLDFGPPHGLWTYRDDGTWQQLHGSSSEGLVSGQFH